MRIDPQEIIEFPCLLVRADDLGLIDQVVIIHLASILCFLASIQSFLTFSFTMPVQFHEYVKPVGKPLLTDFCTDLTGITQDMIQVLLPDENYQLRNLILS